MGHGENGFACPRPRLRRALSALVTVAVTSGGRAALADPGRSSSLSWVRLTGAESCVGTQELAQKVEARLQRSVFVSAAQADLSVEGHIEPSREGFRAVLTLRDAKGAPLGTRELARSGKCGAMDEPLALVIAVMIDPDAALHPPPPPPPSPPAAQPAEPVVVEKTVYIATPPPAAKPTWRLDAQGSVALGGGLLPGAAIGFEGVALVEPPGLIPFEAFGAAWLDGVKGSGVDAVTLSLLQGGLGLCPLHHDGSRLSAYGCARGELGFWSASYAPASTPSSHPIYLGASLDGGVTLRIIGPFAAHAGAAFTVPILRPDFTTAGATLPLFRPSPVAGSGDVGLGLVFP